MKAGRIADREVRKAWFHHLDPDISAVRRDEDVADEVAEIDRLIEVVERELAEAEHTVLVRLTHDVADERRAVRASRRARRVVPRIVAAEDLLRAAGVSGEVA